MFAFLPRILLVLGIVLLVCLALFIGGQVLTLSDIAARFNPLLGEIVFWSGMGGFGLGLLWLLGAYFLRPKPLVLPENPTPEQIENHVRKLTAQMRSSSHLRSQDIAPEEDAASLLARLDVEAMRETRRTASRIFLTTAVARNGRLDTLIVLILLARLVWKISALYNQRPHPREMVRLYINVAGTALAAGALEDAGLEDHIHALLAPVLAASPMAAVPGISGAGSILTAALVDGSANALLALRVGIVTRNSLSPVLPGAAPRPNPYREAAALLGQMSRGLVRKVMKATFSGFTSGVSGKARKAASAVRDGTKATVHGVTGAVREGTKATVQGVTDAARTVGDIATRTGCAVGTCTVETVRKSAAATVNGVEGIARTAGGIVSKTGSTVGTCVSGVGSVAALTGKTTHKAVSDILLNAKGTAKRVLRSPLCMLHRNR